LKNIQKIDKSSIDFNKIEPANSPKRYDNRYTVKLHVRQTFQDFVDMIIPRGISIKMHGYNVHKNKLVEGSLINVSCNTVTPNVLDQREYNELIEFINTKLDVIRDNPYELKNLDTAKSPQTKIETEIVNEDLAQRGFNFYERDGKIYGQL